MKKLKIHYHSDNTYWAGSEQMMVVFLTSDLIKKHFDVTFSYRYSREYVEGMKMWLGKVVNYNPMELIASFANVDPLFSRAKNRLMRALYNVLAFNSYKKQFSNIINYEKPDIVHINNGGYPGAMGCNAAAIAAKEYGAKVIYMANGITPRSKLRKLVERHLDNKMWSSVDCFLAGSRYTLERLQREVFHVEPNSYIASTTSPLFEVKPNTLHHHDLISKEEIRKRLGVSLNDILIGSVGRLEKRKGMDVLIKAFKRIDWESEIDQKVWLLIVGSGPMEKELLNLGKGASVKFAIGREEDAYSYINAMDVYCQSSIEQEDLPNAILMAMKLGKPIIASSVAGIPELVTDAENGYLVSPGSETELRAALSSSVRNIFKQMEAFGEKSRLRYETRYSNEVVLNRYLDLCNRLTERGDYALA